MSLTFLFDVWGDNELIYYIFPEAKNGAALQDHVYMDAMGFGMGCCCLQLTFQACSVAEARRIYDSFVPLAPIFVCLPLVRAMHLSYSGYSSSWP